VHLYRHAAECSSQSIIPVRRFEPQREGSWCGLASISTALQCLITLHPHLALSPPTQEALFEREAATRGIAAGMARQLPSGLSLAEGARLIESVLPCGSALSVRRQSADVPERFAAEFDIDLLEMASSAHMILVNLIRQLKGVWTGHWMVVAGSVRHDDGEVWVLVLDPAAHKLGPHWLPVSVLLSAMCTCNVRGEPRGYVTLSAPPPAHPK